MKTFNKTITFVAVTALFATAFTTFSTEPQHAQIKETSAQIDTNVAQVVILGKRMSLLEKVQYDIDMLTKTTDSQKKSTQNGTHLALK